MARERTLDEQDQHFRRQEKQWQAERAEYQQQIQQLLATLRTPWAAAA